MFSTQLFETKHLLLEGYDLEKDAAIEAGFTRDLFYAWMLDVDEPAHPLTVYELKKKREGQLKKMSENRNAFYFSVKSKEDDGRFIGVLAIPWVMWSNGEAAMTALIGEPELNRLYLAELLEAGLRYCFEELHMYYVTTLGAEFQPDYLRALMDAGMQIEVRQRQLAYWQGRFWDRLILGISAEMWNQRNVEE